MNIRWAALAAILLVAAGCASTSKVMLGRARAPIDPALVQIYSTPPAGSQEIAQLESASAVTDRLTAAALSLFTSLIVAVSPVFMEWLL